MDGRVLFASLQLVKMEGVAGSGSGVPRLVKDTSRSYCPLHQPAQDGVAFKGRRRAFPTIGWCSTRAESHPDECLFQSFVRLNPPCRIDPQGQESQTTRSLQSGQSGMEFHYWICMSNPSWRRYHALCLLFGKLALQQ